MQKTLIFDRKINQETMQKRLIFDCKINQETMQKKLIFDCEIINCIYSSLDEKNPNFNYCDGWTDYKNMGISVIGTWRNFNLDNKSGLGKYEAFVNKKSIIHTDGIIEEFKGFLNLIKESEIIIGFNSFAFDDKLCAANYIPVATNFDLLRKIRVAAGMPADYARKITKPGYNLSSLASYNLKNIKKTGNGENAAMLWQKGKKQEVIDYCLNDVKLTKLLYFKFINGQLKDPWSDKLLHPV